MAPEDAAGSRLRAGVEAKQHEAGSSVVEYRRRSHWTKEQGAAVRFAESLVRLSPIWCTIIDQSPEVSVRPTIRENCSRAGDQLVAALGLKDSGLCTVY